MIESRALLGDVAVVLTASRAGSVTQALIDDLRQAGFGKIVLVDDGWGSSFSAGIEGVQIATHMVALGKDACTRTGINFALCSFPAIAGIVICDTDRNYSTGDVVRVAEKYLGSPNALVLGAGPAGDGFVSRFVVRVLSGAKTSAPGSGLRAMPAPFASSLLSLNSAEGQLGFHAVVAAREQSLPVLEVQLESDHFQQPQQALQAGLLLLRLGTTPLLASLIDILIFSVAYHRSTGILVAQLMARAASMLFLFLAFRKAAIEHTRVREGALRVSLIISAMGGAVSYFYLRLAANSVSALVVRTKILTEVLLLCTVFAAQRALRSSRFTREPRPAPVRIANGPYPMLWWFLLLIPVGIEISGFRSGHLLEVNRWAEHGQFRFDAYVAVFATITLCFAALARRYFLSTLVAATVLCSIYAVGPLPVSAVLLFIFSVTVLGRLVFGEGIEAPLAFLAGVAFWIVAMYSTSYLPVHYAFTYLIALAVPIAAGSRHSRKLLWEWLDVFRPREFTGGEFAGLATAAFVLLANWLIVLKPEVSTDALTTHLAVSTNIALNHAFTVDFRQFIWALTPLGTDFCYTVVYLLGGEYASRLLNFAMLTGIAVMLFRAAGSLVPKPWPAFVAALFLSTPIVYLTTGSMFVENFVAAMVLGAVLALCRYNETAANRYLFLGAVLFGTSIELKLGAVAPGLLGLATLLFLIVRGKQPRKLLLCGATTLVVLSVGLIPYAKAYALSGNPFFPFENGRFHSRWLGDENIVDERYQQHFNWKTPAHITFHTNRYYEGQNGSFGFQYLLFLPLMAGVLVATRSAPKSFRGKAAIGIGGISALVIAVVQPNARYFYPTMPLLTLGIAFTLAWLRGQQRLVFQASLWAALAAGLWNIWFLPTADWYHRDFYSTPLFSEKGRHEYLNRAAPVREAIDWVNRHDNGQPVLLTDGSEIAGLQVPVSTNHWLDHEFISKVFASTSPLDVYHLFARSGFAHLVVNTDNLERQDNVTEVIAACGQPEFSVHQIVTMKMRPDCEQVLTATRPEYGLCAPGEPLPAGKRDEVDPLIRYKGPWHTDRTFPSTYNRTVTYSNAPGAQICVSMEGTGFNYVFTRALNRGHAEVLVDGARNTVVDLYSKEAQWQSRITVSGLKPGRHEVAIVVLPAKDAESNNYYVDIDAIEIF